MRQRLKTLDLSFLPLFNCGQVFSPFFVGITGVSTSVTCVTFLNEKLLFSIIFVLSGLLSQKLWNRAIWVPWALPAKNKETWDYLFISWLQIPKSSTLPLARRWTRSYKRQVQTLMCFKAEKVLQWAKLQITYSWIQMIFFKLPAGHSFI